MDINHIEIIFWNDKTTQILLRSNIAYTDPIAALSQ